jgi:hypothetical protein
MTDIVSPTPVGNAPPAPLVTDTPAEFNTKAFSLAGWYQPLVTALNGVTANVFNNATAAQERATAAGQSAVQAGERRDEARGARDEARGARDEAQVWATSAVNAPGTSGTSTSSLVVAAGTKTLVTQAGKAWVVGQPVVVSRTSAPAAVQMWGTIFSYATATGTMAIEVPTDGVVGDGMHSDWTIALAGRPGKADILTTYTQTPVIQMSQQISVPAGTRHIEALLCGGGDGGNASNGAGGDFGGLMLFSLPVFGAPLDVIVGTGGLSGQRGGSTTVSISGAIYAAVGTGWPGKAEAASRWLSTPIWSAAAYPRASNAVGGAGGDTGQEEGKPGGFGSGGGFGLGRSTFGASGGAGGSCAEIWIWGLRGQAGGITNPGVINQWVGGSGGGGVLGAGAQGAGVNGGAGGNGGGGGGGSSGANGAVPGAGGNGFAMFRFYK